MSRRCTLTGKGPMTGNSRSHSNRKARKTSLPNLQSRRIWVPKLGRFVRATLSARAVRTLGRTGADALVAAKLRRP